MGRRKKYYRARVPFVKLRFKVNRKTFFNIIGLLVFALSLISLLSFTKGGSVLQILNQELVYRLGRVSILFPFLLFLFSSHFFSTRKLKLIRPNITLGLFLIIVAFLGFLRTGYYGRLIIESLISDFSYAGALIILIITFLAGFILFFNTSLDAFLLFAIDLFKKTYEVLSKYIFRSAIEAFNSQKGKKVNEKGKKDQFVQDAILSQKDKQQSKDALEAGFDTTTPSLEGLQIKSFSSKSYVKWTPPPLTLISDVKEGQADYGDVSANSSIIEDTLESFGLNAKIAEVNLGPTVTQYGLQIAKGTKLSKITALSNDLGLALATSTGQVRIEAPIPGRSLVGIEIPNKKAQIVTLRGLLNDELISKDTRPLFVPMGLDVSGKVRAIDITGMPHILIAGTTGSGKSVLLNAWICSILFRASPEQVRLILVDPKRVEMTLYNGIPHLLTEVIVEPKKIISALKWTVSEMETRYKLFAKAGARNISSYNRIKGIETIPYLVFIIDELADLMVYAPGEVEELITRIAQMARATGIHLLLATQRPSVDVITGLMKANIPARVAFNVASMVDSRVVLDTPGAEKLLGKGDMLFLQPDQARPRRIQGPLVLETDVSRLVDHFRKKTPRVDYTEEVTEQEVHIKTRGIGASGGDKDVFFKKALQVVLESNQASASFLQRRLSIGYARAARILDQLQAEGYVGPAHGSKPREILSRKHAEEIS